MYYSTCAFMLAAYGKTSSENGLFFIVLWQKYSYEILPNTKLQISNFTSLEQNFLFQNWVSSTIRVGTEDGVCGVQSQSQYNIDITSRLAQLIVQPLQKKVLLDLIVCQRHCLKQHFL